MIIWVKRMITKYMKMLCMFDLPVDTAEQQRAYRKFRKDIMSEGPTRQFANQLEKRLQKIMPKEGNVRLLTVTEKQYDDMKIMVGSRQLSETALGIERMIVI